MRMLNCKVKTPPGLQDFPMPNHACLTILQFMQQTRPHPRQLEFTQRLTICAMRMDAKLERSMPEPSSSLQLLKTISLLQFK